MAHVRQQIREAVATAISPTGVGVFQSRVYDLESGDLPAFKIYTLSEGTERDSLSYPRGTRRQLQLVIECVAKAVSDLDDTLDDLCAQAEAAIVEDITLGGLSTDAYLETTTIELNDGGDQPHGVAAMSWIVEYRVKETDPEVVLA